MPNIAATISLNVPAITALCKGEAGNTILNGTVNPSGVIGNEGDFFLNVATAQLFGPKSGGLWPSGVVLNNSALAPDWNSVYTSVRTSSGSWNSAYTTSRTGSADWNNVYTTTRSNSANWNNTYTTVANNSAVFTNVQNASANRNNVYTTVRTNSANWTNYDLGVRALTSNWQSTYTTVFNTSGSWGGGGGGGGAGYDLGVRALTSFWDNTYTVVRTNSANWSSVYTSARSNSGNWNAVYTTVYNNSAGWEAGAGAASTVTANAPYWNWAFTVSRAVTADRVQFTATSGNWDWAYSNALTGQPDDWTWAYNNALSGQPDNWTLAYVFSYSTANSGLEPNADLITSGNTYSINGGTAFVMRGGGFNGKIFAVNVTATAPVTATIPSQATTANNWRDGASIRIAQLGTAKVQVSAAPGITISSTGNQFRTNSQGAITELFKVSDTAWLFTGDRSAV